MYPTSQIKVNIYTWNAGHKLIKCVCFFYWFSKDFDRLKVVLPKLFAKFATFFTKATQVDYLGKLGEVLER